MLTRGRPLLFQAVPRAGHGETIASGAGHSCSGADAESIVEAGVVLLMPGIVCVGVDPLEASNGQTGLKPLETGVMPLQRNPWLVIR
jgi:hypothetical protein